MGNQIRITPDHMRTRAGEYRAEAGKVGEVISKMDSLLTALESEWEGAASASYSEKYRELKPGFEKAQALIEEIARSLDGVATSIEETDRQIARQFKG